MFKGISIRSETYFQLIIALLLINLLWVFVSYFYHLKSFEGIISSSRLFLSAVLIYFVCNRIEQGSLIKFLVYLMAFNGVLVGMQVIEQLFSLDFLPLILKYGGIWGFSENHDYEIFRKGGIFPSSQSSSLLSLLVAAYIISNKNYIWLLPTILLAILFGGRTTVLLSLIFLGLVGFYYFFRVLGNQKANVFSIMRSILFSIIFIGILYFIVSAWFGTEIGNHHLTRIQQAFFVVFSLDFSGGDSGGTAFEYFRFPSGSVEVMIGNGLPRYHELGGNDPFYTRWLLQSGLLSLFLLILVFILCFLVEWKRTQSSGIIMFLLLIHSFKGEVISSIFFFDVYLLYLFSKPPYTENQTI